MRILGVEVDEVGRRGAVEQISSWVKSGGSLRQVVTIYSELLLRACEDRGFKRVVEKADLVVPDGVGVLAAMEYQRRVHLYRSRIRCGMTVGLKGVRGKLGEPVTGVWLFEELVRLSAKNGWRVFLLGGFNDVARDLATKLQISPRQRTDRNYKLQIGFDKGEQGVKNGISHLNRSFLGKNNSSDEKFNQNDEVIKKINKFKPDLLFVAYGPGKQEKWIYENKKKLKAGVAIGVGGTFNEVLGKFPKTPGWMEKRGLKAIWRLLVEPKRCLRVFRAMMVFPWKVYRSI